MCLRSYLNWDGIYTFITEGEGLYLGAETPDISILV